MDFPNLAAASAMFLGSAVALRDDASTAAAPASLPAGSHRSVTSVALPVMRFSLSVVVTSTSIAPPLLRPWSLHTIVAASRSPMRISVTAALASSTLSLMYVWLVKPSLPSNFRSPSSYLTSTAKGFTERLSSRMAQMSVAICRSEPSTAGDDLHTKSSQIWSSGINPGMVASSGSNERSGLALQGIPDPLALGDPPRIL